MRLFPYLGLRLTSRGLKPYAGIRLSLSSRRRPAHLHQTPVVIYHCSVCGHVNAPDSKFCSGCGAVFTLPPKIGQ